MGVSAAALRALALRTAHPYQQFGQASDAYTANGATGCTHTVMQFLVQLWTGQMTTHDQLSKIAGYPNQSLLARKRGFYPAEVRKIVEYFKLPYQIHGQGDGKTIRPALTVAQLYAATQLGPVGFGHSYSYWPEHRGFVYMGRRADGIPNGYAANPGGGRTQLSGFSPPNDAHFGCLLGAGQGRTSFQVYAWEPNHGSGSRPEKPPYDIITTPQFAAVYASYKSVLGRTQYSLVPTRALG